MWRKHNLIESINIMIETLTAHFNARRENDQMKSKILPL